MKIYKRVLFITMLSLITLVCVWMSVIFEFVGGLPEISDIELIFHENQKEFEYIEEYLNSSQESYIYVDTKNFDSRDPQLQNAIETLYNNHIMVIQKSKNYILFSFGVLLDSSCGLLYREEGRPIAFDTGLTKFSELDETGWFYFHHTSD